MRKHKAVLGHTPTSPPYPQEFKPLNTLTKLPRRVGDEHLEKPFLRNTELYVCLVPYLTVASFIDFEKSQKFFLLFICLIVAK